MCSCGETGGLLGFITPMSHNFCESCNRVRLTATGQLYMCLGQDDMVDLRAALREGGPEALDEALDRAMLLKPKGHDFILDRSPPRRHWPAHERDRRLDAAHRSSGRRNPDWRSAAPARWHSPS
jgi:molybdenum cofactor biosynthesis enzyme MoaA